MRYKIEKMGINGEGIARDNKGIIFIDGAITNEEVEAKIYQDCGRYRRARLLKVIKAAKERVKPCCPYFEYCGACQIMHLDYSSQLIFKHDNVAEALYKYAGIDPDMVEDTVAGKQVWGYRNSLKLPIKERNGKLVSGLYREGSNRFLTIDRCMIHDPKIEKIRKNVLNVLNKHGLRAYDKKTKEGIRGIFVRGLDDHYQLALISGKDSIDPKIISDLARIEGLEVIDQYRKVTESTDFFGKELIHLSRKHEMNFRFAGLDLAISTRSFFQLNTSQAEKMYRLIADMTPYDLNFIFEAYAGIGVISLFVKDHARRIVGVESIASAVRMANRNAQRNHIGNVSFECDDAPKAFYRYVKEGKVDFLIVDPPRVGLNDEMIETIMRSKIKGMIYVSCNPSTLGKDLHILGQKFKIKRIVPLDIFAQSAHVETVVLLEDREHPKR